MPAQIRTLAIFTWDELVDICGIEQGERPVDRAHRCARQHSDHRITKCLNSTLSQVLFVLLFSRVTRLNAESIAHLKKLLANILTPRVKNHELG